MNETARRIIMNRRHRETDSYDSADRNYDRGYDRGYNDAMRDRERDDMREDEARRRSMRTGRFIRDSYDSRRDYEEDMEYDRGEKLSRSDMEHWKRTMSNEDGTKGAHFSTAEAMEAARMAKVNVDKYGQDVFCMTMNMMYSDYMPAASKYGVNRPEFYADLAKNFLDDKDFDGEGAEKLMIYYKTIVEKDQ